MFGVNWNDPQTLWLNLTNATLALVTLAALIASGFAIAREITGARRARGGGTAAAETRGPVTLLSSVGPTMADGGEPIVPQEPRQGGPLLS